MSSRVWSTSFHNYSISIPYVYVFIYLFHLSVSCVYCVNSYLCTSEMREKRYTIPKPEEKVVRYMLAWIVDFVFISTNFQWDSWTVLTVWYVLLSILLAMGSLQNHFHVRVKFKLIFFSSLETLRSSQDYERQYNRRSPTVMFYGGFQLIF